VVTRQLHDVVGVLGRVEQSSARLENELDATPYMADPDLFRTTGRSGEVRLGYSSRDEVEDASAYRMFEDIFRGAEDFIRDRQRVYVDLLANHEPVLDVGCGRGELLDLLREAEIEARGIDVDGGMVAYCREKGHDVKLAEATEYLDRQRDRSLGAIFAAQVIEHMPYEALIRFFALARTKLADGGILIMETVNPHSIPALKTFWVDLTHEKPIFPEVALALCHIHGFESARVFFPNGGGRLEEDRRQQGEYAVVATVARAAQADDQSARSPAQQAQRFS
jgi:2-polyprenyl-3-methyl-5-hydroxy-6-metoxy-1,4-benzoquinol methylase